MNTALAINLTTDEKAERMEARLLFRSIFGTIPADIYKKVDRVQYRARRRTLDQSDVMLFLDDVVEMIAFARQYNIPISKLYGRLDAGAVTNNYSKRGQTPPKTTAIWIDGQRIEISRRNARTVAYGDDGRHRVGFLGLNEEQKKLLKDRGWNGAGGVWTP